MFLLTVQVFRNMVPFPFDDMYQCPFQKKKELMVYYTRSVYMLLTSRQWMVILGFEQYLQGVSVMHALTNCE